MKKYKYRSALTIAGFDGSGGAGIQADMKTFSALGCYATSVLTALPIQNTQGVRDIYPIPSRVVQAQIASILDDIFPEAIKIGMVHSCALVKSIVDTLNEYPRVPLVFDPVMVATSGHRLIAEETVTTIIDQLFPLADLITPNMDEAAVLAEMDIKTVEDMYKAGEKIRKLGCPSLLLKGGHLNLPEISSLYFAPDGAVHRFQFEKFATNNTHGSGCTLSSAIAAYLAQGKEMLEAVSLGQDYTHKAIYHGRNISIGKGKGPLNHFFDPQKLITNDLV